VTLAAEGGRVVVVTGGASGIGRAVVERLHAGGTRVVVVDRDEEALARLLATLDRERAEGVVADVAEEGDVERYLQAAIARFGHLDGLHANAGIEAPAVPLWETETRDFDRLMAVNLRGVYLALRGGLRELVRQGEGGAIVTTASTMGVRGRPNIGPYSASKAGVIALTRTAAREGGPFGIRANAVLPGPTSTPMLDRTAAEVISPDDPDGLEREVRKSVPLGRLGRPEEVAALVVWLLGAESSFVSGGAFTADGGEIA
jgi:NAD(P)-dependent dehydrogenase (short-subunit alcohol dehydrogenase family)